MVLRASSVGLLIAVGCLWLASGTQREKAVLAADGTASVRALEGQVAAHPEDVAGRRALTQAYLDVHAPGLALRAVESAPPAVQNDVALEHVYARALIEEGRATEALAVERRVLGACAEREGTARCDTWLLASATRRAEILASMVELGVDDPQAHPEMSAIAYHKATRQATIAFR